MKLFNLIQDNDIIVAEGVIFTDGRCALNWLNANYKKITGMAFFDCKEHITEIHGHDGRVNLQYVNEEDPKLKVKGKDEYIQYGSPECFVQDPDKMCKMCSCWKMTRKHCS
jgi:hypothetical protein